MSNPIELKAIKCFLCQKTKFFIPSYQRGYKWTTIQVEDLLNDINEFNNAKQEGDFYCLQPLVVKEKNGVFRILDGQQRITTLYLILKYLGKSTNGLYSIEYETREDSQGFLKDIHNTDKDDNPDYIYMSNAYDKIELWFKNNDVIKDEFYKILTENVQFIYYKVDEEDENAIFTRLNIGKIALTNAEIIKAMFILHTEDQPSRILLSTQWDDIETKLQDDKFFSFLFKDPKDPKDQPTRIDVILDMVANEIKKDNKITGLESYKGDERETYYIFNSYFKENPSQTQELWKKVKHYFRIFNELYDHQEYYHLVGYLISTGKEIHEIVKNFKVQQNDKFLCELTKDIQKHIEKSLKDSENSEELKDIKELTFDNDYDIIKQILFLFNVISTMNTKNTRYRFDLHNQTSWSLEHIFAQNYKVQKTYTKKEDLQTTKNDMLELLKECKEYVTDYETYNTNEKFNLCTTDKLITRIEKSQDIGEKTLETLKEEFLDIQQSFEEIQSSFIDILNLNSIDNLALLIPNINSSLSNSSFYQKRKLLLTDHKNSFIPPCTMNVFLKYYTTEQQSKSTIWSHLDRINYLNDIKTTLTEYLPTQGE